MLLPFSSWFQTLNERFGFILLFLSCFYNKVRMYHGDIGNTNSDSLASQSPALCGEPFAYNPHSGMYIKFGKTYITHVSFIQWLKWALRVLFLFIFHTFHLQSMAFPNKAQQNDIRQSLPPITGIYPTMNMMLTGKIRILNKSSPSKKLRSLINFQFSIYNFQKKFK